MIIAIYNLKGGVGKTTLAWALSSILTARGYRVLSVDLDSQCNLSYSLLDSAPEYTVYDALIYGMVRPISTAHWGDVLPGCEYMDSLPDVATDKNERTLLLRRALSTVSRRYDIILLDCPPGINLTNANALSAAERIITPTHLDTYSLQGIHSISRVIAQVKRSVNAGIKWSGIVVTDWRPRLLLTKHLATQLKTAAASLGTRLYDSAIKHSTKINELILNRLPIRASAGDPYIAYDCLTDNILNSL